MGWRFQRRIRIAPGVTLNLSKRGLGISAGMRGARVGMGPRGVHRSLGLPGTGISHREERSWASLSGRGRGGAHRPPAPVSDDEIELQVADDGSVTLVDAEGLPLPPGRVRLVREARGEILAELLADIARIRSGDVEDLLQVHLDTPPPDPPFRFQSLPFAEARPEAPVLQEPGVLGALLPGRRARVKAENEEARTAWESETRRWLADRKAHEAAQADAKDVFDAAAGGEPAAMETLLEMRLAALTWPRETCLSFELHDGGRSVWLDVDLPPASEMPRVAARPAARGLRILQREKSETQLRREYMTHVHGVVFRVVGTAFHTLPRLDEVVASAYTQTPNPATGAPEDTYLLSARIPRDGWATIHFDRLEDVDLPAAFARFDLRRSMTRTGIFRPVEPHVEGSPSKPPG